MAKNTRKQLLKELLKPLCDADGEPYLAAVFENDLSDYPEMSEEKAKEVVERIDRLLAGDKNALDSLQLRD